MTASKQTSHKDSSELFSRLRLYGFFLAAVVVLLGVILVVLEWARYGQASDLIFVGLLAANTFLMLYAQVFVYRYLERHHETLLIDLYAQDRSLTWGRVAGDVFHGWHMLRLALLFGLIFAGGSWLSGAWKNDIELAGILAALMFCNNLFTGAGIHIGIRVVSLGLRVGSRTPLGLWDRSAPQLLLLEKLTYSIAMLSACISTIGVLSMLFSPLNHGVEKALFSFLAIALPLAAYLAPRLTMQARLREMKRTRIAVLNSAIEREHALQLSDESQAASGADLRRVTGLHDLLERTRAVSAHPVLTVSFLGTFLKVVALATLPIAADVALKRFL